MENYFEKRNKTFLSFKKIRKTKARKGINERRNAGRSRIMRLLDQDSFEEYYVNLRGLDPLKFPGYQKKLERAQEKTGNAEGVVGGRGSICGIPLIMGALDGSFLMGSMGSAAGEKLCRLMEDADRERLPLVLISASGGARMQEGLFSLFQMAKTAAAVERFSNHGGLYVSILTHPTTGGVSASYASLGDIVLAEPGALIGFAGPRVIQQTIGQKLPQGFQRSEFQLEHGFVDAIVEDRDMRETLYKILILHGYKPGQEERDEQ